MNNDVLEVHNTTLDWLTQCIVQVSEMEDDLDLTKLAGFYAAISQETACITNIIVRNLQVQAEDVSDDE